MQPYTHICYISILVMVLYEVAKTRIRVDTELSKEFEVKVEMHHRSVLSLFAVVVHVVNELTTRCVK